MSEFDYIIVGGGSAGCVLANRLTENPNVSVCLLETGPPDKTPFIQIPAMFAFLQESEYAYQYDTVPQKGFNEVTVTEGAANAVDSLGGSHPIPQSYQEKRKGFQPRGRTLGGSSSVNGMVYIRGHKWDYDHWSELGNNGWSYDEVLPYFKRAEHNEVFDDNYHGQNGPLNVCKIRNQNTPTDDFVKTGSEIFGYNDDFNGENQEGIGYYQTTQKDGKRCSAAKAYLVPSLDRDNLTIMTDTNVNKIIFENKKAVGVECLNEAGELVTIYALKEVILSSGAFGSPQILLRSGVGPSEEILKHNIEHVHELPGVGKNLQDHIDYLSVHKYNSIELIGFSLKSIFYKFPLEILKYIFAKVGMFTSTVAEAGGFIKSSDEKNIPDIQLHFAPAMVIDHGRTSVWGHGLSCHVCLLRPKSRGEVTLNSADPLDCLLYTSPSPRDNRVSRMPSSA